MPPRLSGHWARKPVEVIKSPTQNSRVLARRASGPGVFRIFRIFLNFSDIMNFSNFSDIMILTAYVESSSGLGMLQMNISRSTSFPPRFL